MSSENGHLSEEQQYIVRRHFQELALLRGNKPDLPGLEDSLHLMRPTYDFIQKWGNGNPKESALAHYRATTGLLSKVKTAGQS